MKDLYDLCIIGGGVVGCAIAAESSKFNFKTLLIEKESDVAEGISKANSGVIHAGFNVKTGSLKAKLNIEGIKYFPEICNQLNVPYSRCKKMVIAKNNKELKTLESLLEQGKRNLSEGLSIIDNKKIKYLEPLIKGKYALFSEKTAIISPYEFTIALAENAFSNGVDFLLNSEVEKIINHFEHFEIKIQNNNNAIKSKIVINSAGLFSDNVARMVEKTSVSISPCRGEYYVCDKESSKYLKMAVYPVPPTDGSGLGVHLTPTINGNIIIGPSAEYINDKNDVSNTKETMDILKKEAYDLLPQLKNGQFIKTYSGIRPKLFNSESNKNFEDFFIEESIQAKNFINLIGIESPGLTSAPAIAKYIFENIISKYHDLKINKKYDRSRKGITRTRELNVDKLSDLIKDNDNYGEIICRCEHVSKQEILDSINNPLKVLTMNSIKKRSNAMMGRCQGGYCIPKISEILTKELRLDPKCIIKNKKDSRFYQGYNN